MSENHTQSERLKKAYGLSARDRRAWNVRIMNAQEAVEKAQDAVDALLIQAWEAGMSYAALGGVLGSHNGTMQKRIEDARAKRVA